MRREDAPAIRDPPPEFPTLPPLPPGVAEQTRQPGGQQGQRARLGHRIHRAGKHIADVALGIPIPTLVANNNVIG